VPRKPIFGLYGYQMSSGSYLFPSEVDQLARIQALCSRLSFTSYVDECRNLIGGIQIDNPHFVAQLRFRRAQILQTTNLLLCIWWASATIVLS
jgi:hypothetical protein